MRVRLQNEQLLYIIVVVAGCIVTSVCVLKFARRADAFNAFLSALTLASFAFMLGGFKRQKNGKE
jgi:hypothetical protein